MTPGSTSSAAIVMVRNAVGLAAAVSSVIDQSADSVLPSNTGKSGTNTRTGAAATTRLLRANTTHSRTPEASSPTPTRAAASTSPTGQGPPARGTPSPTTT